MQNESWKFIEGTNNQYMISDLGNVLSVWEHKQIILKLKDIRGYKNACLWVNKKRQTRQVHRLVALHFIPNPENKPQVNHKNHIKGDNRVENLEWVTNSENIKHSFLDNNRSQQGENNNATKLTNEMVRQLKIKGKYASYTQMAKDLGIHRATIFNILKNKMWTHIVV